MEAFFAVVLQNGVTKSGFLREKGLLRSVLILIGKWCYKADNN
jgi:hypothetical protein